MKTRRHHNNDGRRQIKGGKTREQVKRLAKRLGIPYGSPSLTSISNVSQNTPSLLCASYR